MAIFLRAGLFMLQLRPHLACPWRLRTQMLHRTLARFSSTSALQLADRCVLHAFALLMLCCFAAFHFPPVSLTAINQSNGIVLGGPSQEKA